MKLLFIVLLMSACSPIPKVDKTFEICAKDNEYIIDKRCIEIEIREK